MRLFVYLYVFALLTITKLRGISSEVGVANVCSWGIRLGKSGGSYLFLTRRIFLCHVMWNFLSSFHFSHLMISILCLMILSLCLLVPLTLIWMNFPLLSLLTPPLLLHLSLIPILLPSQIIICPSQTHVSPLLLLSQAHKTPPQPIVSPASPSPLSHTGRTHLLRRLLVSTRPLMCCLFPLSAHLHRLSCPRICFFGLVGSAYFHARPYYPRAGARPWKTK